MASSPRHLANGITSRDHHQNEAAPTPTPVTNGKVPTDSKTHLPNGKTFPYRSPRKPLIDRFIDEPRALRVAVIGGGLAGITAGILLPAKVPNINLTIYDKNADFGGTWLENVYPGVRCDIPSHVYQSTFAPKLDWSDQFSTGAEILAYWQSTARKHDVYQYAEFGSRIVEAVWDAAAGAWTLRVQDVATGAVRLATADFVLTSTGRFNAWKLPAYPGLSEYRGLVRHSSNWDPAFDAAGKTVAVIGNGASGIQLVASLQPSAARLDHYARHPTWIAASWAGDDRTAEPQPIPEPQKASFQDDPATYLAFRKQLEDKYWRRFSSFFRDSESNQDLRRSFIDIMKRRLVKKPELLAHLVPDFSPNCRRLTPGPGYLEAITQDNVEYITAPIRRFTASGIETEDGVARDVDAVFCATGANVDLVPEFPIRAHGQDLREVWAADGEHGFPYTYLGLATPGFPNLLFVHGPHGTGPSGTVPHSVENQLTYFAKVLRKVAREGIRSLAPSARAADDFVAYADDFFATTVLSDPCSSWYNGGRPGGRIHGVWPGSAGHVTIVRREPRWEDWEYEYLAESGNRFSWYFGNGWTRAEGDDDSDMTPYLKLPGTVDLKDIHESWWDIP